MIQSKKPPTNGGFFRVLNFAKQSKMNATISKKQAPAAVRPGIELRLAKTWGMDPDARAAARTLENLAADGRIGVIGRFMPDSGMSGRLRAMGVCEEIDEADFFGFSRIVIPYGGVCQSLRKRLEASGRPFTDLTSPSVRRAQVALGLLRVEGAQALVIGRHDDGESKAIASGARIIEQTTDTARLAFAPAFGAVCQTTLSPRRVTWLVQQLRLRYRDARVSFLDTAAPSMAARGRALENLLEWCDGVVVVGDSGEASCAALEEAALRRGKPAFTAATSVDLEAADFTGCRKIALTAGGFATDHAVRDVATALMRR